MTTSIPPLPDQPFLFGYVAEYLSRMLWRGTAARRRPQGFIDPCIPTLATKPPVGPQWIHEIKHDGYRLIVCRRADRVRVFTRRGYDCTERYPLIREAMLAF